MLEKILNKSYKTVISAFPTPSKGKLHAGNLRGILIQDYLARFSNLAGQDTFFPFGLHPTGFPTFGHVETVLSDLAYGTDDLRRFFWDSGDLDTLIRQFPDIIDISREYGELNAKLEAAQADSEEILHELELQKADLIHQAALPVVNFVGSKMIRDLELYNVDTSQFDGTFLTTITPWYQEFTKWWVDNLYEAGFINFLESEMGYCSLCDRTKEVTSDMDEVIAANLDSLRIIGSPENRRFNGDVYCKVSGHRNHLLDVVTSEGWKFIYNAELKGGKTLADLTSEMISQKDVFILPKTFQNSIHSLFASREPKNIQRDYCEGLGTESRFSDEENPMVMGPLMDSNGYFFMFAVAKAIYSGSIPADKVNGEFFDYVLRTNQQLRQRGFKVRNLKGRLERKLGVKASTLSNVKEELHTRFSDWINIMGWDHSQAHALFSNMQIAAQDLGHLMQNTLLAYGTVQDAKGQKMGKSLGNAVSIDQILDIAEDRTSIRFKRYGFDSEKSAADVARLYLLGKENPVKDLRFDSQALERFGETLLWVIDQFETYKPQGKFPHEDNIDMWLMSKVRMRIESVAELNTDLKIHKSYEELFFDQQGRMLDDIAQYHRMKSDSDLKTNRVIIKKYWQAFAQLASPFIPYVAGQIGRQVGLKPNNQNRPGDLITDFERNIELEQIVDLSGGNFNYETISAEDKKRLAPVWRDYAGEVAKQLTIRLSKEVLGERKELQHVNIRVQDQVIAEILGQELELVDVYDYLKLTSGASRGLRTHLREKNPDEKYPHVDLIINDVPQGTTYEIEPVYAN
ncbi:MAG: Leucine--tRNA ligase [Candidatus Woesearchaeota archaeon]|nr:Leucine--tRNA ligase [Candidatus Woesearchaeota archaeon]